jgi:hypothetical protein
MLKHRRRSMTPVTPRAPLTRCGRPSIDVLDERLYAAGDSALQNDDV